MGISQTLQAGITAEMARQHFEYRAEDGSFWYRTDAAKRAKAGTKAGYISKQGYGRLKLGGRSFFAHRVAWLHYYGIWPAEIDHINGNRGDNRICNLREATRSQNAGNRQKRRSGKCPYKGITRTKFDTWQADITFEGKDTHLGSFKTPEEAHAAYVAAARRLFGEFARAA